MKRTFLAFVLSVMVGLHVQAQNADIDFMPLFKGIISDPVKLAIQDDGKIIVGGSINSVGSNSVLGICRINPDGSLDEEFNSNLRISGRINDLIVQSDGKIMIVGQTLDERGDIIRLLPDGSYDPTFILDQDFVDAGGVRIRQQSDGKYILAAFKDGNIFRLTSDGSHDPTFDVGKGTYGIGISYFDIQIQSDDKVLVGGTFTKFNEEEVNRLVRINSDGTIDPTFNIGTGPGSENGYPFVVKLILQSDNKILVAGDFDSFNGDNVPGVVRLNESGSIDGSFLVPGELGVDLSSGISRMDIMDNGKIVLATYESGNYEIYYRIILLDIDGSRDLSYSTSNIKVPWSGGFRTITLRTDHSGNIYVAGAIESLNGQIRIGIGATDSLGNVLDFNPKLGGFAEIKAMEVQSDNKIVVGGSFLSVDDFYAKNLVRLNEDGTVDESFVASIGTGSHSDINAIEIQTDGKILVGGGFQYFNNEDRRNLVRLEKDGSIDQSFNPNILRKSFNGITEIYQQNSDKIIVAGSFARIDNISKNNFARLNGDGGLDISFNSSNLLQLYEHVFTMEIQNNEKILIGGKEWGNSKIGGFLYRTDLNGNIDDTFIHDLDLSNTSITKIACLSDNRILLGTYYAHTIPYSREVTLIQLDKDGVLIDNTSITTKPGEVKDILVSENNNIFIAGQFEWVNESERHGLAKVSLDGEMMEYDAQIIFNNLPGNTIGDILKLDDNTLLIGGKFNQIKNIEGFSGLAKISLSNVIPVITSVSTDPSILEDTELKIELLDIIVEDDNLFPDDFQLILQDGDHYSITENVVIPDGNYFGVLEIPVIINDGWDNSEPFNFNLEVVAVNDVPVIEEITKECQVLKETPFSISLDDLLVSDPDNTYPDDMTLYALDGENYSVNGEMIMPDGDFVGELEVQFFISDGTDSSEIQTLNATVFEILGVNDDLSHDITIYPNPFNGFIQIRCEDCVENIENVTIYDRNGIEILSKTNESKKTTILDLPELEPGLYIIEIKEKHDVYKRKLLKL